MFLAVHIIIVCGNPKDQIADSVIVSGYTTPAVEGTTVTFQCLPGLMLNGINSSMCMENGEWEPAPHGVFCSGIHFIKIHVQCLMHIVYHCLFQFYTDGLISGHRLSGDLKIAISTSVTAFIIGSILFFIAGFLCRHLYPKRKEAIRIRTEAAQEIQDPTYYDDVVIQKQEQELELKENVAYDPIHA